MEAAVNDYTETLIKNNAALGELNHPQTIQINPERACHKVLSLVNEGNVWRGTSQILTGLPMGDILANLIRNNCRVGFSTRGVGDVDNFGTVNQYKLAAVDAVLNPSGPGCYMDPIMESKSFMINEHGEIMEVAYNTLENNLRSLPKNSILKEEVIAAAFRDFFKSL
jgi:hypothetical protein